MNFSLTNKQDKLVDNWKKQQIEKSLSSSTIGGRWTYSFTPTSLGFVIKIIDNKTNEIFDITDYDSL
jgi:hypothetical protein